VALARHYREAARIRELDDALGLTDFASRSSSTAEVARTRTAYWRAVSPIGIGRLAGYEDVNDAERLARDAAMRAIVGREGLNRAAASGLSFDRAAVMSN
jgi:hypothetical protein